MSYQALPYTYGARTEAQIDSISGMRAGATVFNTTSQYMETYNGRVWMDERSVCFKVASEPGTVTKGELLKTSNTGEVELAVYSTSQAEREKFVGIATRSSVGGFVPVAHCGKVKALAGGTIVRGRGVIIDGTAGRFDDNGSPASGTLGLTLETGSSGSLLWIALQTIEISN
jgi:hypothetical protein